MTNQDILRIAMEQSAWDMNCRPEDFTRDVPVLTAGDLHPNAKKYYSAPNPCRFLSYGTNVVAAVKEAYRPILDEYLHKFAAFRCFETPALHWLDDHLAPLGQRTCFMAEYYLPDVSRLSPQPCACEFRLLHQADFAPLYQPEWSNALCEDRKHLDVLGFGAYDGTRLIGLAGCSADGENMWQIGVDVLPEYRRRGIAASLTSHLALAILERGKVPFYSTAWSNIRSVRNAIKCGFIPAWVEVGVKPRTEIDEMNR